MKYKIIKLIEKCWKFDSEQQPISTWHDKQYLLDQIEQLPNDTDESTDSLKDLDMDYNETKSFLMRAGIIDKDGNLTERYK